MRIIFLVAVLEYVSYTHLLNSVSVTCWMFFFAILKLHLEIKKKKKQKPWLFQNSIDKADFDYFIIGLVKWFKAVNGASVV